MNKVLMIECCAQCHHFEYSPISERNYCNLGLQQIIPKTIDPSDDTPGWCPLPDWEKTFFKRKK